ncbi:MAG: sulfatase-like hydrolase/transferase [Planctomycetota bacterium]
MIRPHGRPQGRRPNVLIFCVDQMRADHMAPDGNPVVRTPNLDRIAAAGTTFARAYCNNPICMPARATMFTGLLPRDHGLLINGQSLRRDLPTLPGILAAAGYATHAAGKLHLTPWVPKVRPPDFERFPECLDYWKRADGRPHGRDETDAFPTPYYGFQSVDFVGGHTSYAYGDYRRWLHEQGGEAALLTADRALAPAAEAPSSYRMAMPAELHYNRFIADATITRIEAAAAPGAPPVFSWCSFPDPHLPVAPPRPYCDMYDPADVAPPHAREGEAAELPGVYRRVLDGAIRPNGLVNTRHTQRQLRELIALTYGMVSHLDAEIGRVLDAVERTGQADETIVAFICDHGDMMGDHGLLWKAFYTFSGCVRIPWIIAAPHHPGGRRCDALTSQIDLVPTVLDLCGVEHPGLHVPETPFPRGEVQPLSPLPGRSAAPLLDGSVESIHDEVVIENDDASTGLRPRALVTAGHRLTVYPATGEAELFDLREDPHELHNLFDRRAAAPLRRELTDRLLRAYCRQAPLSPLPPWNA